MIIYLVWDTSGSMAEWAKQLIARGVARAMEQYLRLGYGCADLKLVAWSDEARILDWCPNHEFPKEMLVSKGTANAKELITLIGRQTDCKVLLLTDGLWSHADAKELKRWKETLKPDTIRFIKIGPDANPQLKGADVFGVEDLLAALDGWLKESME